MTLVDRDFIFLQYALMESANALRALDEADRLARIREVVAPGVERLENDSVFAALQAALHSYANTSRVFWPTRKAPQSVGERCARLRDVTGLDEDHPLSSRRLRDHIEHMDERLDAWTAASPRPFLSVQRVIHEDLPGEMEEKIRGSTMLVFDARVSRVQIFDQSFDLADLRTDLLSGQKGIQAGLEKMMAAWP